MPARLGDDVDDFCIKCKRITNHVVVSLMSDEPAKVRCRSCHSDHDYRREQAPPPKVDARKAALFKQVLGDGPPGAAAAAPSLAAAPALAAEASLEIAPETEVPAVGEVTTHVDKPKTRRKAQGQ